MACICISTRRAGSVRYTIHVENEKIPDYTATAYEGENIGTRHEFQMIGLVPGEENTVTMELLGRRGKVLDTASFTVTMPETMSGYSILLDSEDGNSSAELSDGLYAMIRVGGHTGYAFSMIITALCVMRWCWRDTAWTASSGMREI